MKIASITLRNFRCFGDSPTTVELAEDITALVGANGSGKTALLIALTRLFGTTQNMRTIRRSDFHAPLGAATDDPSAVELSIEVILIFPELTGSGEASDSVAPAFNHMIVDSPGGDPFCRLKLEARWTDDGTIEGHVDQDLYWILTAEESVPDDRKLRVTPNDRGRIQVYYIPANRDPAPEFRSAARNSAGRLVRAISWVQGTRDTVQSASEKIGDTLGSELAVIAINRLLQERWDELRDDYASTNAALRFGGAGFDEIVRDVGVIFSYANGSESDLAGLSEGQQSLIFMALV
ncbi:MAG: AAA family ATPase, partial [Dehalococcoidia bacterium]|nr:AAA family ATPase [Dehalococcoidia bacterium]